MSIASMAANIKQRQKITHPRPKPTQLIPETEIKINTQQYTCNNCKSKKWFKFMRCPECQTIQ